MSTQKPIISASELSNQICDIRFMAQLKQVQLLKRFLFEEKVKLDIRQLESIDLASLNGLRYRPFGRAPNSAEWAMLDEKLSSLASYLTDELRQRFRVRELGKYFSVIPISFLSISSVTVIYFFLYPHFWDKDSVSFAASYLVSLVIWTLSQGGLGACAFLGTRLATKRAEGVAVAVALDEVADITDKNILRIRILLGCLFGSLMGLPVAGVALDKLRDMLYSPSDQDLSAKGYLLIVVPFLVGFSTNLTLAILDRFVVSVRTLFGIAGGK